MFYEFGRQREFNCISYTLFVGSFPLMTFCCLCVSQITTKRKFNYLKISFYYLLFHTECYLKVVRKYDCAIHEEKRQEESKVSLSVFDEIYFASLLLCEAH